MPRIRVGAFDLAPEQGPITPFEPDRWGPRHALAARMKGAGLTNKDISAALDLSINYVSIILNDERARPYILEAQQRVADGILDLNLRLKAHAEEALNTIVDQMRASEKEVIRQKAALSILDRAGYTPVQRHTIVQQPQIPDGLGSLVNEAHAEIIETRRTVRFRAPAPTELALPSGQEILDGT